MATIVCFHAHPDDESIATGGTMAKASAAGHRVVLVIATRGELGEVPEGFLDPGEPLGLRRITETFASAKELGVDRVEFLGYVDSGMIDTPGNDFPYSFWQADVEAAASRLASILRDEAADVLTIYDDNGGYGHPDHIQVHRVGSRAAEMAGVDRVFESTMNRDAIIRSMKEHAETLTDEQRAEMPDLEGADANNFGKSEDVITHAIDVTAFTDQKRASMRCHRSQIPDDAFFLSMEDEVFQQAFGTEWFIAHRGPARAEGAPMIDDLFAE
ncbi:MAG: PIG-L family deacetylase [Acidimicrobiales bacterium]